MEKGAVMSTKVTVIYDNPTDPVLFEKVYGDAQISLVRALPGLETLETSKVWPKEDGSVTPAYRMIDMYFADYDAASSAVTTPEATALFSSVFDLATGGVRILFSNIEETRTDR
jgi:uncharacterized protein (TIGR02118 family)